MAQSRRGSFFEAVVNTIVGFGLSFILQKVLAYAYDVPMSNAVAGWFVFWFSVFSIVRSYTIRRVVESAWWARLKRFARTLWFKRKYSFLDPDECCCGERIGTNGSICHHGGCRSYKEFVITKSVEQNG